MFTIFQMLFKVYLIYCNLKITRNNCLKALFIFSLSDCFLVHIFVCF